MKLSTNLAAFAFVQETLINGGDFVEALAPIFIPIAEKFQGQEFSPEKFVAEVKALYGLEVHQFIAEDWVDRLCGAGILEKKVSGNRISHFYAPVKSVNTEYISTKIEYIFSKFYNQLSLLLDDLEIPAYDKSKVEEMFFERIRNFDFDAIASRKVDGREIGSETLTLESFSASDGNGETREQIMDVFLASYLMDMKNRGDDDFDFIVELSLGVLATSVITSLRAPIRRAENLSKLEVFLDAPILLDLLDLGGDEDKEYARNLYDNIRKFGGTLCAFTHSVSEVSEVIQTTLKNHQEFFGAYGPLGHKLRVNPDIILHARSVMGNPNSKIKELGIELVQSGKDDGYKYYSREQELDVLGQVRPFADKIGSREYDASSIAETVRYLLRNTPVGGLLNQRRIFVSKNKSLCLLAERIIRRDANLSDSIDVPFVDDRYLGGLFWLATGSSLPEIPMSKLIANCTAAIRPRRDVLKAAYQKMRTAGEENAKQFEALMANERCTFYMARVSLGQTDIINRYDPTELLEEIKQATAFPELERTEREFREKRKQIESKAALDKEEFEKNLEEVKRRAREHSVQEEERRVNELNSKEEIIRNQKIQAEEIERQSVDDNRKVIQNIFDETKIIEDFVNWSIVGLIGILYVVLMMGLENNKVLITVVSFVLAGVVPSLRIGSKFFQGSIRRRRQHLFEQRVRRYGLGQIIERVGYNWKNERIEFPD